MSVLNFIINVKRVINVKEIENIVNQSCLKLVMNCKFIHIYVSIFIRLLMNCNIVLCQCVILLANNLLVIILLNYG